MEMGGWMASVGSCSELTAMRIGGWVVWGWGNAGIVGIEVLFGYETSMIAYHC